MYEIGRIITHCARVLCNIFIFCKFMISECYLLWRDVSTFYTLKFTHTQHTRTRKNKKLLLLSAVYFSLILLLYIHHIYHPILSFYIFTSFLNTNYTHTIHSHTHKSLSLSLSLSLSPSTTICNFRFTF